MAPISGMWAGGPSRARGAPARSPARSGARTSSPAAKTPPTVATVVETGPEILRGSTRMKAGTAQKLVLNMLSTAVMARRGLVYRGEMIAMRPTNVKLKRRAIDIVGRVLALPPEPAERLLESSSWELPVALVSGKWGVPVEKAREWIAALSGNVARALDEEPTWG